MARGFVYVLVNSSIPGLVKIGCTTRPPAERAAEISCATGVAMPFILAYEQEFAECELAERDTHLELDRQGLRVAANREFFRCTPGVAIRTMQALTPSASSDSLKTSSSPPHDMQSLIEEGDHFYYGEGDHLQDVPEAMRLYRQAARLGSGLAEEKLGAILAREAGQHRSRLLQRRAIQHFKAGARLNNGYCWLELALLYGRENHERNCGKAFGLFIQAMPDRQDPRFINGCCRYVATCYERHWAPTYLNILRTAADAVLGEYLADFNRPDAPPRERERILALLRFSYELLLPMPARPPCTGWRTWPSILFGAAPARKAALSRY